MKVDILIPVADRGGCENIINMLVPFIQKERGWNIRVVQLIYEDLTWIKEGIPHYPLLEGRNGHNLEELVAAYADFLRANRHPDVILATAWPFMCYIAKKATVMTNATNTVILSWLHSPVKRYELAGFGSFPHLALADAHLTISDSIAREIAGSLSDAKIFPVHNPVDFKTCRISSTKGNNKQLPYKKLYFIGRISKEKRIDLIIRALKDTNGTLKLYIIGDGEDRLKKGLHMLADECQVSEYMEWLGWQSNPWKHVTDAEAMVISSDYEGFPLVAIEALSNGIPIISTPVSGITDIITPGVNGYLFPFEDWRSLHQIFMMIADNRLPSISSDACKQSVAKHKMEYALLDFADKIENFAQKASGTNS